MASGGGGAWKVAYADFVTAMMAFFMVMWLTSQKPEVVKAVAEHFRNPGGKRMAGNDAKSASVGHSRSKFRAPDPHHAALHDGIIDA